VSGEEKQLLGILLEHVFEAGFVMINTCSAALSTPMTETEVDALVLALAEGLTKISPPG
jgi:glutamate-1-semialdehyde 2,1-aminomutase